MANEHMMGVEGTVANEHMMGVEGTVANEHMMGVETNGNMNMMGSLLVMKVELLMKHKNDGVWQIG